MDISKKELEFMINAAETAKSLKIESVIIESGKVRAMDESRTVVMFQGENVPDFDFGSICIGRIPVFLQRVDLGRDCEVTAILSDDNSFVKHLKFSGKRVKIDFRASNPSTVMAPKNASDAPLLKFKLDDEAMEYLVKGAATTKSEVVTFKYDGESLSFSLKDVNKDSVEFQLGDFTEIAETAAFEQKYPIDTVLAVTKLSKSSFNFTTKGMLNTVVNRFNVYIPKRVE